MNRMEETVKRKLFQGAGILIGFALGFIIMLIITAFTGKLKAAIPIGIATGSSLGPVFENYISPERRNANPVIRKLALLLISLGGIFFVIWYFSSVIDS